MMKDAEILNMFGVSPQVFLENYALPLDSDKSYTTKIGIYEFLSDYEFIMPKVRSAYNHYYNIIKDIEERISKEQYNQYLVMMSGRPFVYKGQTYIRTTKKTDVGSLDEKHNAYKVELTDTVARNMAIEMAKTIIETDMEVDVKKMYKYKESFKNHLDSIVEVSKTMIAKLASLSNDHKVMSGLNRG